MKTTTKTPDMAPEYKRELKELRGKLKDEGRKLRDEIKGTLKQTGVRKRVLSKLVKESAKNHKELIKRRDQHERSTSRVIILLEKGTAKNTARIKKRIAILEGRLAS